LQGWTCDEAKSLVTFGSTNKGERQLFSLRVYEMIDLTKTIEMEKHNNKEELGFNSFDMF